MPQTMGRVSRLARPERVAVGVDRGGTWLRVRAVAGHRPLLREQFRVAGAPALHKLLSRLWRRHGWSRSGVAALVVASRGVWTAPERAALARRLRRLAGQVAVLPDAQAALLGALDDRPGVLVIAGTGSIVIGRDTSGHWARAGGLGPLLDDEGSAFWIGREWLRATHRDGDLRLRAIAVRPDAVARIAARAPGVLRRARRGDRRARAIVADAQRHLAGLALAVARRLHLQAGVDASWSGGVMNDPRFRAGVVRALRRAGLRVRWRPPAGSTVEAAARLAARLGRLV
jgi:glucosamine kinase